MLFLTFESVTPRLVPFHIGNKSKSNMCYMKLKGEKHRTNTMVPVSCPLKVSCKDVTLCGKRG